MTHARIVVAGATTALTRRTMFRKLFWTPSRPEVTQGYLYALALAQTKTEVLVHHGTLLSNHAHLTVTPTAANLPTFLRLLHRESSCFLKAYLAELGHPAPPNVWDARAPHCMRLVDPGAQLAWLAYEHVNCVAAGLVRDVASYPGWVSDFGAMKQGVVVIDKPDVYFGRRSPKQVALRLTPPPLLMQAYDGDVSKMVYDLERTARAQAQRIRQQGRGFVGPEAVKRRDPWSEPVKTTDVAGARVPRFKVANALQTQCANEQRAFLARYRHDRTRWSRGERRVVFAYGTYGMRVFHGATVEDAPASDAILAAPGPLPGDETDGVWTDAERRIAVEDAREPFADDVRSDASERDASNEARASVKWKREVAQTMRSVPHPEEPDPAPS